MLAHRNGWFSDGNLVLPAECEVSREAVESAGRIAKLGDAWDAVSDSSLRHRYWGGMFEVREASAEELEVLSEIDQVFASLLTEQDIEMQRWEAIAHTRLEQVASTSHAKVMAVRNLKSRIADPRSTHVPLAPNGLVSALELMSLYVLDRHFYYDPRSNATEFAGLTILEWLRGNAVLEGSYTSKNDVPLWNIVPIDPAELRATLMRAGLSDQKAAKFIDGVTFRPGRRDLFDAPLLSVEGGKLYFLAAIYQGIALYLLVASQIGSRRRAVDVKGGAFERQILTLFRAAGIPAHNFKFRIGENVYQCDLAVLWDDHLFIFECKNYELPTANPTDRFHFAMQQADAAKQVERIKVDLVGHPDILRKQFGENASWKHAHAIVLNALPFSMPQSPKGIYFYDSSALHRFMEEGTFDVIESRLVPGGAAIKSSTARNLWSGSRPSPEDLLSEMKEPTQIRLQKDQYFISREMARISRGKAVRIVGVRSNAPDPTILLGAGKQ
jgi:hypothetical protein